MLLSREPGGLGLSRAVLPVTTEVGLRLGTRGFCGGGRAAAVGSGKCGDFAAAFLLGGFDGSDETDGAE